MRRQAPRCATCRTYRERCGAPPGVYVEGEEREPVSAGVGKCRAFKPPRKSVPATWGCRLWQAKEDSP